jgi:periplasmic protein TonB
MKSKNENLDDVVFEERNKNYGAYFLRRSYNKNVTRALFLSTLLFLSVVSIPLIAGLMNREKHISIGPDYDPTYIPKPPDPDQKIDPPPETKPIEKIKPFTVPKVVDSTEIVDTISFIEMIDNTKDVNPPVINDSGPIVVDITKKPRFIDPTLDSVFIIVKEMPEYTGGLDGMYQYLSENIKYPIPAMETGIKGTVYVTFVVEKDGSISSAALLNDIGGGCGAEALRVVKSMPKWNPGRQNGTPVRVQFNLPVRFVLE